MRIDDSARVRLTLESPDPLFARLKALAAMEWVSLKHRVGRFVEQGLASDPAASSLPRSAKDLPSIQGPLALRTDSLSTAGL